MLLTQSTTSEKRMLETWQNLLDEYEVRYVLLEVDNDHELINGMLRQTKWAVEVEDEEAVLFTCSDMAQIII